MRDFQRGNAFLYVLIAVALLGALMFTLSRSAQTDAPQTELSDNKAKIAANDILAYAAVASNAITQMQQSGATTSQIDFMYPDDANFNTAPTIYKLFHPDGGGLNYKPLTPGAAVDDGVGVKPGYYIGRFNNVIWSPTTAKETMFTAYKISKPVCEAINMKVLGSKVIPATSGGDFKRFLIDATVYSGSNVDLTVGVCADCEDHAAMCVSYGTTPPAYAFYSILEAE